MVKRPPPKCLRFQRRFFATPTHATSCKSVQPHDQFPQQSGPPYLKGAISPTPTIWVPHISILRWVHLAKRDRSLSQPQGNPGHGPPTTHLKKTQTLENRHFDRSHAASSRGAAEKPPHFAVVCLSDWRHTTHNPLRISANPCYFSCKLSLPELQQPKHPREDELTTTANIPNLPKALPGRRYDRYFFSGMALLILAMVIAGFGPTYYFAGGPRAPLPNRIIHVHGAIFSAWILLIIVQNGLVAARRVALHRTLGLAGFGLAVLVVIAGFLAMASQLHFRAGRGDAELTFSVISAEGILLFGALSAASFITRRSDPAAHKRLITLATIGLVDAAIFRTQLSWVHHSLPHTDLVVDLMVLSLVFYDLWSLHKIHRATLWGSLFFITVQRLAFPVGSTPAWHTVARWIQSWNL